MGLLIINRWRYRPVRALKPYRPDRVERPVLKLKWFFSDYDGTLAPIDVPPGRSRIPRGVEGELRRIAARIPFAVITSKDFGFIHPRTSFAHAWACANGLEIRLSNGQVITRGGLLDLRGALSYVRKSLGGVRIEKKKDASGRLMGFSIDWRKRRRPSSSILGDILDSMRSQGFSVLHNGGEPFIDVFAARTDKGEALVKLIKLMGLGRKAGIFVGDSPTDNLAFERSGISVCVAHGQNLEGLKCKFIVDFRNMRGFLSSLLKNDLDFTPRLQSVHRVGDE